MLNCTFPMYVADFKRLAVLFIESYNYSNIYVLQEKEL
jgi:hypothetical protein